MIDTKDRIHAILKKLYKEKSEAWILANASPNCKYGSDEHINEKYNHGVAMGLGRATFELEELLKNIK